MLIIALILAVIGLAALVTAVVTSNELIAWVCIGASVIGVLLLIVDAVRERSRGGATRSDDGDDTETTLLAPAEPEEHDEPAAEEYPDEPVTEAHRVEPDTETVSVPTEGTDDEETKRD